MIKYFNTILTAAATLIAAYVLTGGLTIASAEEQPRLRTNIVVTTSLVTLGDIFENAGEQANIAVFRAPDLGKSGMVRAARVQAAAQKQGLTWSNEEQVAEVQVTRDSTEITEEMVTATLETAIRQRLGLTQEVDLTITLAAAPLPYHLPFTDSGTLEIIRLDYRTTTGQFRAELRSASSSRTHIKISFRGQAIETIQVPVLSRTIARGEVIQASDLQHVFLPRRQVRSGILLTDNNIVGMAARRGLQGNRPLRIDDVEPPKLVLRNKPVVIAYQYRGLTLSVRGRAIADGALGDMVRVMNTRSNRIIEGVVSGYGRVMIERIGSPQMSANTQIPSTRIASSQ